LVRVWPHGLIPTMDEIATITLCGTGLTKVYRSGPVAIHALRGVDVALYEGELVVPSSRFT
jgi:hypothetical protein